MSTFKPGDKVRCVADYGAKTNFVVGSLHTIYAAEGQYVYLDEGDYDNRMGWMASRFELVKRAPRLTPPQHRAKVGTFPFLTEHRAASAPDVHTLNATRMYSVALGDVTPQQRADAKRAHFGQAGGMTLHNHPPGTFKGVHVNGALISSHDYNVPAATWGGPALVIVPKGRGRARL